MAVEPRDVLVQTAGYGAFRLPRSVTAMPNELDALLISLISACTALVASIVGPVVTLAVSKRQFSATVLSANRQKWIESLRDLLAEVISLLIAALLVRERWKDKWNKGRGAVAADPALLEKVQRLALAQAKVRLMINPEEKDHLHLHQAIMVSIRASNRRMRSNRRRRTTSRSSRRSHSRSSSASGSV